MLGFRHLSSTQFANFKEYHKAKMQLSRRKTLRLQNHDYANAEVYFVTLCVQERKKLFWEVGANFVRPQGTATALSDIGIIVDHEIQKISTVYDNVWIEKYCIMPDHIHLLVRITPVKGDTTKLGSTQCSLTLSRIVKQFKGSISKQTGYSIWQKSFYDHIIWDEKDYEDVWDYIDTNPLKLEEEWLEGS